MDLTTDNKRFRTSPRTNAFQEVLALIDSHMKGWDQSTPAKQALTNIREAVAAKVGTQHEVEKPATGRTRAPKGQGKSANGTHYVGMTESGTLTYMSSPDMALNAGNYPEFSHIYGPFNTRAGAEYAIAHDTYTSRPQLF